MDIIAATGLVIVFNWDWYHWFSARANLTFDGRPRKMKGHLFYATSSFVHHIKSISEFRLELQSRNAHFGSKSAIFCLVWPWNLTDDLEKQQSTSSMLCWAVCAIKLKLQSETLKSGQNRRFYVLRDLEISRMTLKNNKVPLLYCFKLCASFHSHKWIQT